LVCEWDNQQLGSSFPFIAMPSLMVVSRSFHLFNSGVVCSSPARLLPPLVDRPPLQLLTCSTETQAGFSSLTSSTQGYIYLGSRLRLFHSRRYVARRSADLTANPLKRSASATTVYEVHCSTTGRNFASTWVTVYLATQDLQAPVPDTERIPETF
jgi:hypothetical protein